jgi:hypothetical protein
MSTQHVTCSEIHVACDPNVFEAYSCEPTSVRSYGKSLTRIEFHQATST